MMKYLESIVYQTRVCIYVVNGNILCNMWRMNADNSERMLGHWRIETIGLDGVE